MQCDNQLGIIMLAKRDLAGYAFQIRKTKCANYNVAWHTDAAEGTICDAQFKLFNTSLKEEIYVLNEPE